MGDTVKNFIAGSNTVRECVVFAGAIISNLQDWIGPNILPKIDEFHTVLSLVSGKVRYVERTLTGYADNLSERLAEIAARQIPSLPPCTTVPCLRSVRRPDFSEIATNGASVGGENFYRNFLFPLRYAHLNDLKRQVWLTPGLYDHYTAQSTIPLVDRRTDYTCETSSDCRRPHCDCIAGYCVFSVGTSHSRYLLLSMHPTGYRLRDNHASLLVVLDGREQTPAASSVVKIFELQDGSGRNFTGRVGGLAIVGGDVWTTDDSLVEGRRNNLLVAFSLDAIFDGIDDSTATGGALQMTKSLRVDARPSSLFYDSTPGAEMLWVVEYSMDSTRSAERGAPSEFDCGAEPESEDVGKDEDQNEDEDASEYEYCSGFTVSNFDSHPGNPVKLIASLNQHFEYLLEPDDAEADASASSLPTHLWASTNWFGARLYAYRQESVFGEAMVFDDDTDPNEVIAFVLMPDFESMFCRGGFTGVEVAPTKVFATTHSRRRLSTGGVSDFVIGLFENFVNATGRPAIEATASDLVRGLELVEKHGSLYRAPLSMRMSTVGNGMAVPGTDAIAAGTITFRSAESSTLFGVLQRYVGELTPRNWKSAGSLRDALPGRDSTVSFFDVDENGKRSTAGTPKSELLQAAALDAAIQLTSPASTVRIEAIGRMLTTDTWATSTVRKLILRGVHRFQIEWLNSPQNMDHQTILYEVSNFRATLVGSIC